MSKETFYLRIKPVLGKKLVVIANKRCGKLSKPVTWQNLVKEAVLAFIAKET